MTLHGPTDLIRSQENPLPRPRVLLVAEDPLLRDQLTCALDDEFLIEMAESGEQALRQVLDAQPDLVVTDVVMPEVHGIKLLRTLRNAPGTRTIPVLLIWDRTSEELRLTAFEEGADGYLAKPYTEQELRAYIRGLLRMAHARAEATRSETLAEAERKAIVERAILLESITDAFYTLDRQWRFRYINQLALDYFKKPREEVLGKSVWDLFPETKGSDVEKHYRKALREQRSVSFETLSPFSGRWVDLHIYPTVEGFAVTFRDITERKQVEAALRDSEAALRRSEERYRAFVANSSEGIWRYELREPLDPSLPAETQLDHIYRHAYLAEANDAVARMYGYERAEELIGASLDQTLPRANPGARAYLRHLVESGYRLNNVDSAGVDKQGRRRHFLNSIVPVFEECKLVRVWGVQRDVTERVDSEERLERQRRLYEAILTNTPDLAYIFDLNHRFIYANEGLLNMWGKTWDQAIGKNCLELGYEPWHAAMHDREIEQVVATRKSVRGEVPFTGTFGRRIYDYLLVPVLNADGQVEAVAGTTRDVTEQKLQQQAALAASARDALRVRLADTLRPLTDPAEIESAATRILNGYLHALRILYVETTPDLQYGVVLADNLSGTHGVIGRHRLDDYGSLALQEFRAGRTLLVENTAEDSRLSDEEKAKTAALGIGAHLLVPLIRGGRPVAALAVHYAEPHCWSGEEVALIEEFAERTWVALERARREQEVREANRRKDEFLATLAHELRNPLAPLQNATQLLKMSGIGEAQANFAREIIERQVQHMVHLVDDLMDVSRITLGQINLRHEKVNLGRVITDALESSRPAIEAGDHSLDVHLPASALYVEGDSTRLSQVFQNLLNNAAKYTPIGGRIALHAERREGEVFVSVRDNGIGIEKGMQRRIFDLFTRVDPSESIKVTGLGIGLALARQLVERHGGRIEVHSGGLGKGSEFTVVLPLLEPKSSPTPPVQTNQPANLHAPGCRVLVVDDNRDAAESLAMLLQTSGCQVSVAFDGHQALASFANSTPEVVLLDIGMPGMDGYDVARRMRAATGSSKPYIVAVTGWGQPEDKRRAFEAGFNAHVTKPVDPAALAHLLAGCNQ